MIEAGQAWGLNDMSVGMVGWFVVLHRARFGSNCLNRGVFAIVHSHGTAPAVAKEGHGTFSSPIYKNGVHALYATMSFCPHS